VVGGSALVVCSAISGPDPAIKQKLLRGHRMSLWANLCLLGKLNKEVGRKPFSKKKTEYGKTDVLTTYSEPDSAIRNGPGRRLIKDRPRWQRELRRFGDF